MKRFILISLLVLGLGIGLVAVQDYTVLAAAKDEVCKGIGAASGTGACTTADTTSVDKLIGTVINILSWLVGVISVIMIIFAGFQYVTSGGDTSKTTSAKNTLIYALIGVVIVAFAQTLVRFVLTRIL